MRTELETSARTSPTSPATPPTSDAAQLLELGLMSAGATPSEQREAIRTFQQARHLPETGVLDEATRAELTDALRMRRAMLRNAAAAGEGGPIRDASSTLAEAQSLAMVRFASLSSSREVTQPRAARALGRNLSQKSTPELMQRAARLQQTLDTTPVTPRTVPLRREALKSLVALYDEVDRRVTNAPLDERGLPELGVEWDESSPLAGATLDLPPFERRDEWAAELAGLPRSRPRARTRRRRDPIPIPIPTPIQQRPISTSVPADTQQAVDALQESEGGFLPGWVPAAATPAVRAASAVSTIAGPIGSGILNVLQLANAWVLNDNNNAAAGRALGVELALSEATLSTDRMLAAVRDGKVTSEELLRIIRLSTSSGPRWNKQAEMATTAIRTARRRMREGVDIVARMLTRALVRMTERLDQEGVDDPAERNALLRRAANETAGVALRAVQPRIAAVREAMLER